MALVPATQFTETQALLLAMEDAEVDSGIYAVDDYLRENFLINELRTLRDAADVLSDRTEKILQEKREG